MSKWRIEWSGIGYVVARKIIITAEELDNLTLTDVHSFRKKVL